MKKILILFPLLLLLFSCDIEERENKLKVKEQELAKREQELTIREQTLASKEEELNLKQQIIDSTKRTWDSVGIYNETLIGEWTVLMNCTETNCEGSAIGDTKTEQWTIAYENNQVIAKAFSKKKLVRIYKGIYNNNVLTLSEDNINTESNILVELVPDEKDHNKMKGTRTIIQPTCKIIYSLDVNRMGTGKGITNILN